MTEKENWRTRLGQVCFCIWMIAVQLWYYSQFKALVRPFLDALVPGR